MGTEISKDSQAYDSIMFLTAYTTAGYKIIPVSKGKLLLPSPLQLLEGAVSLRWSSPPIAGDGIYVLDPRGTVTLIHTLHVWVRCLILPVKNTIFELRFDDLHQTTSQGCGLAASLQGKEMCHSSSGDNRDPRCPNQAQDTRHMLGAWQGGQS